MAIPIEVQDLDKAKNVAEVSVTNSPDSDKVKFPETDPAKEMEEASGDEEAELEGSLDDFLSIIDPRDVAVIIPCNVYRQSSGVFWNT